MDDYPIKISDETENLFCHLYHRSIKYQKHYDRYIDLTFEQYMSIVMENLIAVETIQTRYHEWLKGNQKETFDPEHYLTWTSYFDYVEGVMNINNAVFLNAEDNAESCDPKKGDKLSPKVQILLQNRKFDYTIRKNKKMLRNKIIDRALNRNERERRKFCDEWWCKGNYRIKIKDVSILLAKCNLVLQLQLNENEKSVVDHVITDCNQVLNTKKSKIILLYNINFVNGMTERIITKFYDN